MQEQVFRKNEGLILVCQNNEDQSVVIFGANKRAQEITAHDEDYLKGRSLMELVPKDIRETLLEYIEFEDGGPDLASVAGRLRDFRLLNAEGDEVQVSMKIALAEAKDQHYWYRLILRDERYEQEVEAFKDLLAENFKGHEVLDSEIGLPDRGSMLKDIEVAHYYAKEKGLSSCFAVIRLDRFEELRRTFGKAQAMLGLRQVGDNLKRNLRADDTVGRMGDDCLGLILVDITQESARVVINRLRWLIASEPLRISDGPQRKLTVSVAFCMVGSQEPDDVLEACDLALSSDNSPNVMIEK